MADIVKGSAKGSGNQGWRRERAGALEVTIDWRLATILLQWLGAYGPRVRHCRPSRRSGGLPWKRMSWEFSSNRLFLRSCLSFGRLSP